MHGLGVNQNFILIFINHTRSQPSHDKSVLKEVLYWSKKIIAWLHLLGPQAKRGASNFLIYLDQKQGKTSPFFAFESYAF